MHQLLDVLIIGAGQAGLASAYYLRRLKRSFVIIDEQPAPGGAWRHTWDSLHLFSPASMSSLPGWMMPATSEDFPRREAVIDYLARYESRYQFDIRRPRRVESVTSAGTHLTVISGGETWQARAVISATGTWGRPYTPTYPGQSDFKGLQLHSAHYRSPEQVRGGRVLVVGGGNSGAQILAEVSQVARADWITLSEPKFLPDEVDGRMLFERASARVLGGAGAGPVGGIGDIVMVPPVKAARARGVLHAVRPFTHFTESGVVWPDGTREAIDAVIWCTGFGPALDHLRDLNVLTGDAKVEVQANQSIKQPRLWLIGYGDWTGAASATLIGAGRVAREMVPALDRWLGAAPA